MIILTPDQQQTANKNFAQGVTQNALAPVDSGPLPTLDDTLKNALPPLPPFGGPLKNEYSDAPYKNAVTKQ